MGILEKIILMFCTEENISLDNATSSEIEYETLTNFNGFIKDISDKEVLDWGCGKGHDTIYIAQNGAQRAVGIDINESSIKAATELANKLKIKNIEFITQNQNSTNSESNTFKKYDIILSKNSMEHFRNPEIIIKSMKSHLKKNGKIYITFCPPWFAPFGGHIQFFLPIPWAHILFPQKVILNIRKRYRSDGAMKYEDIEGGLNKLSVHKFEKIIKESGLKVHYKKYTCLKEINILQYLPILREFFINKIDCVLVNE